MVKPKVTSRRIAERSDEAWSYGFMAEGNKVNKLELRFPRSINLGLQLPC